MSGTPSQPGWRLWTVSHRAARRLFLITLNKTLSNPSNLRTGLQPPSLPWKNLPPTIKLVAQKKTKAEKRWKLLILLQKGSHSREPGTTLPAHEVWFSGQSFSILEKGRRPQKGFPPFFLAFAGHGLHSLCPAGLHSVSVVAPGSRGNISSKTIPSVSFCLPCQLQNTKKFPGKIHCHSQPQHP